VTVSPVVPPPERANRSERGNQPLPFFASDRLSRAEFERRYHAQPEVKKAELIEGVGRVASCRIIDKPNRLGYNGSYLPFCAKMASRS
jgi:hypothetical protein